MKAIALILAILSATPTAALAQNPLSIMGGDGSFLGIITPDKYNKNSICNQYGAYGGKYNPHSIFNEYGTYGGKYSDLGAYSEIAQHPPLIVLDGQVVGVISKNPNIGNSSDRVDPDVLLAYVCG